MNSQQANSLTQSISLYLKRYFADLGQEPASNIHNMVMQQVEKTLIQEVLDYCDGNKTRAAKVLGINRNTLHTKLQAYGLDKSKSSN